ncbi:extracellular solute-binding protein [Clostridium estertheticum]|uniref:extracellular solute-binding protein n=1 Tax=Clostridium estertheticum TaxID=238834 RepID=UPI001C7E0AB1|nr:extracellular solute-binding protein [Clostridium estertheticum]MBX4266357.1 extracellular solute-binding protein [Clostridium estertheticum]MBX4268240.1 extracellular solute-binding protein [Clostridium estertheticum]WLC79841.1 extracellular solute-binding protein [Clostridium estertheticum]WLC86947.1 extracellular solute-binding protein [Clostridium estertheticum]
MNRKFMKISSLLLTIALTSTLMACGNKTTSTTQTGSNQKITLKLWHIWTSDTDSNKQNVEAVIKEWNTANPNVQIEAEGTENEAYKTKIKTAISANEAPDIFVTWGAGFSQPFVDAGKLLPLDDYLKDGTKEKLLNGALTYLTYNKKVYGLPYANDIGIFYVNKELFDKNNIKIPTTYDELLVAIKAFKSKGITPMAVGEKDKWPGMFYYDALALREGGAKLSNSALAKKSSFEDPTFVNASSKLSQLVDAGAFNSAALGLTRDESEVPFLQGKIPMYYNGSWLAGTIDQGKSVVKGKVVAMNFPSLSDGKGGADEVLGGAINGFVVNANTEHKAEAAKAVKFIAENISKKLYTTGAGIPTWKVDVDESKIAPLTKQISVIAKKSTGNVVWWDTYLSGADAEVHKDLVAQIFGKQITPANFAKQMQVINKK